MNNFMIKKNGRTRLNDKLAHKNGVKKQSMERTHYHVLFWASKLKIHDDDTDRGHSRM